MARRRRSSTVLLDVGRTQYVVRPPHDECSAIAEGWQCACGSSRVTGRVIHDYDPVSEQMRGSAACADCAEVVGRLRVEGPCLLFAGCEVAS